MNPTYEITWLTLEEHANYYVLTQEPEWRNWYTHQTQNLARSNSCRFESDLRHQRFARTTFPKRCGNPQASIEMGGRKTLAASSSQTDLGKAWSSSLCRAILWRVGNCAWPRTATRLVE